MKAYVITDDGPQLKEIDPPRPGPHDVLIRVRACGLNRADLAVAGGHMHGAMGGRGATLGMEWAGEVVQTGVEVQDLKAGDRVMASGAGGFAEFAVADAGRVLPIPSVDIEYAEAATLPVALQTMHDAVVSKGQLQKGEAVLIQGASSGVGLMGMQIAKAMGARLVIGSSTNAARRLRLRECGADITVDSNHARWCDEVLEATGGQGVDLAIDQVSGSGFNSLMRATRIGGRIVNVGRLGGQKGEFDFDLHALRRISYIGVTFRTRSKAEVREITRRMMDDLYPLVAERRLKLPIDRTFPFDQAVAALEHMRADKHFGKIILAL